MHLELEIRVAYQIQTTRSQNQLLSMIIFLNPLYDLDFEFIHKLFQQIFCVFYVICFERKQYRIAYQFKKESGNYFGFYPEYISK